MLRAISLARRGKGKVSPNPLVGAVLVVRGKVVAEGFHRKFGGPHAEVDCLKNYNGPMAGSTMYVNLEPCAHTGKTAPCTDLLIQRGVKRVVVGMLDPNPLVSGKGVRVLRRAGIHVDVGPGTDAAKELNRKFATHIKRKSPYINLKVAQSLDGFIAGAGSRRRYISSKDSLRLVHRWRTEYDAVLVGAGTIRKDNPLLNVRFARGRNPAVIILDGKLTLTGRERVFHVDGERRLILLTTNAAYSVKSTIVKKLQRVGAEVVPMRSSKERILVKHALRNLYGMHIGSILVEGGADVFNQFVSQNLIDEMNVFIAPVLIGRGLPAFRGRDVLRDGFEGKISHYALKKVGEDILFHCHILST